MNVDPHWLRVKDLFRQSQLIAQQDRDAWLATQCAGDAQLLGEIRALLAAQTASPGILDGGAADLIRQFATAVPESGRIGSMIGPYRVLGLIGEGGMGSVFLAERADGGFSQRVALKLVRGDFVNADLRARFLRERNFLARLVHPNIAQLHDGGVTADGTPYFTLEYVEGEPVARYCDSRNLGLSERVALMLQVCSAVAYAHRNLIVHRDLKPSNILITGDGQAKLLDFGIAKFLDADSGEGTTATQARMMTPEYAAPEQVLGAPITTATDVYAIGVLLYELLSGRAPYARADAGAVSWSKAVVEESAEPLARALGRTTRRRESPSGESIAASRSSSLPGLRRALRGDIDRIVQRALAKQPEARYPTVDELADDLRAYMAGRAISGGSRRYRVRMFVRRHWFPLAAAATLVLMLIAGGAAILWQSRRVEREARTTLAVKNFLFGLFTAVDPHEARGREVSAHELLDRGAERIDSDGNLDVGQKAEVEAVLGRTYYQLGLFEQAKTLQDDALRQLTAGGGQPLLFAETEAERAETASELGDHKAADAFADDAGIKIDAVSTASANDRARVLHVRARVAIDRRDFNAAKHLADAELALVRSAAPDQHAQYESLMDVGSASWGQEDWTGAEARFREAVAVAQAQAHPVDLDIAKAQTNVGLALATQSRYLEAEPIQKQALAVEEKMLGANHSWTMGLRRDLGLTEHHIGHYAQARALLEQVLAAQRAKLGNEHPAIAGTEINLGIVLTDSGDLAAAESTLKESIAIFEKKYGRDFDGTHIALGNLAAVHIAQRRLDEADVELNEISAREKKRGQTDKDSVLTLCRLGEVKRLRGDIAAAIELQRRAVAGAHEKYGENSRYAAHAHQVLALALRDSPDDAGAEQEFRAALASYAGYIPQAEHPLAATTRFDLGTLLLKRADKRAEALRLLGEAAELREKFLGNDDPLSRQARNALVAAKAATGNQSG